LRKKLKKKRFLKTSSDKQSFDIYYDKEMGEILKVWGKKVYGSEFNICKKVFDKVEILDSTWRSTESNQIGKWLILSK
jgi:hypothetical protein